MQIYTRLDRTSEPAQEPLNLAEVRDHLDIDHEDDDSYLSSLIIVARQAAEQYTGRSLVTQSWTMYLHDWLSSGNEPWWDGARVGAITELDRGARNIVLPKGPIQSVTSIKTYDDSDVATLVPTTTYYAQPGDQGGPHLRVGKTWPSAERTTDGVEIIYIAGYGDTWNDVPFQIRHGMKVMIAEMYENRSETVEAPMQAAPMGAKTAWGSYRLMVA